MNRAPGDLWRAGSARGKQDRNRSPALSRWRGMWQGQVWDWGMWVVLAKAPSGFCCGQGAMARLGEQRYGGVWVMLVYGHTLQAVCPLAIAEQGAESTSVLMGHPQQLCSEHGGGPKVEEPECRDSWGHGPMGQPHAGHRLGTLGGMTESVNAAACVKSLHSRTPCPGRAGTPGMECRGSHGS